jgi:hypothetical protein
MHSRSCKALPRPISRALLLASLLVTAAILNSCTSTEVHVVPNADTEDTGFRFREPLPYLLVTAPVDVDRSTNDTLYTFDTQLGFLPLCGDPDLQKRVACAKTLQDLKAQAGPPPPSSSQPQAPKKQNQSTSGTTHTSAEDTNRLAHPILRVSNLLFVAAPKGKKNGGAAKGKTNGTGQDTTNDPFAKQQNNGSQPQQTPADAATKSAGDASATPKSDTPIQIVWLPNFCRQFSASQKNYLSTAELKLQLTNGWELDSVDATGDSTTVLGKLLDTVGAVFGASSGKGAAKGTQSTSTGAAEALYARFTVTYLKPGLYPLITCTETGFTSTQLTPPTPQTNKDAFGTRVEWTKVLGD